MSLTPCLTQLIMRIREQCTFFFSIITSWTLTGCLFHVDLGSGNLITRSVETPAFDRVDTRSFLDVEVTPGSAQAILVTCDDNLQDNIDVFVDGGTLVFDSVGSLNIHASPGCKAQVTAPALNAARSRGSGNLNISGLTCTEMYLETNGSGDIDYSGQCAQMHVATTGSGDVLLQGQSNDLSLESRGSGDVDAGNWLAQTVSAQTYGSGDLSVNAQLSIIASTRGSGDIDISGQAPQRQVSSSGSGDVLFH